MKTVRVKIKKNNLDTTLLADVVSALKNGQPIVFPTDTVYGIGVSAFHFKGVRRIYRIKKRDEHKPLVWLIASVQDAAVLAETLTSEARLLMERFWPGALTLIVKASLSARISGACSGSLGVRLPRHALIRKLIRTAGVPLATTSANMSGSAAAVRSSDLRVFEGKVPYILDAGSIPLHRESTVVDVSVFPPLILREGAISKKEIGHAVGM